MSELALYDIVNSPGVAADLSHICTNSQVTGYLPENDGLKKALENADVVVIPAGVPRKPGMTRDDLFNINAGIVKGLAEAIVDTCPDAFVLVVSNPVNSTVPIVAEVFKAKNKFNPKKLFGVTTLDVVRSSTFVSENVPGTSPVDVKVPVVGGHSGITIVPLLSQTKFGSSTPNALEVLSALSEDKRAELIHRIQFGGDEVVKAKAGAGSATLSMAFAGFKFSELILKAVSGVSGIVEPTFVCISSLPGGAELQKNVDGLEYFSAPVELGPDGVKQVHGLGSLSELENSLVLKAIPELRKNIERGVAFVHNPPSKL